MAKEFQLNPGHRVPDLSLYVACYNEEENIRATLDNVRDALLLSKTTCELLVIDDASSDRSRELIREWIGENRGLDIRLIANEVNRGLAANFIYAAHEARGAWFRMICGDNVEPRETLQAVFARLGEADVIIPYHVECQGKAVGRRLISTCYTLLINILSGHKVKYYNGLPMARTLYAKTLCNPHLGFGFQADFVTQLLDMGLSYALIPVKTQERSKGTARALTKQNFKGVGVALMRILRRRLRRVFCINNKKPGVDDLPQVAQQHELLQSE